MDNLADGQSFGMGTSDALYLESNQNGYVWDTQVNGTVGQGLPTSNGSSNMPATTTTTTTTTIDYGSQYIPDTSGGLGAMSGLNVGVAPGSISPDFQPGLWQQQSFPNPDSIQYDEYGPPMNDSNGLGIFEPDFMPIKSENRFSLSVQEISTELHDDRNLAIDSYPQEWQNDEAPQIGYTALDMKPSMDDPFAAQPFSAFSNAEVNTIPAASRLEQTGIPDGFEDLFTATELEILANHTPSFAFSPAPNDYQSHSSGNVSDVGNYESPRTPYNNWANNSSPSSSPANGQSGFIVGPYEDGFPHNHLEVMATVKINQSVEQPAGSFTSFDTNPKRQTSKRKRKTFTTQEKEKVNSVRENGACISCRARKVPCSAGDVCTSCEKTTGDPHLAREICLRSKLKDEYLGVKVIHDRLDDRKRGLEPLFASLIGEPTSVTLTVANIRQRYTFTIPLQVMKCTSSPDCKWKRLARVKGIYITQDVIREQRYVIIPSSLPTADQFDLFGRKLLSYTNGSHSGHLTRHLDNFLLKYCEGSHPERLQNFADATLRVASLNRLVAYGFLNLYDGSYDLLDSTTGHPISEHPLPRYVSETVHDQLRLLAAEGLEPTEKKLFTEIDFLPKLIATGTNGRVLAGICILRLMLVYRDRVIRDSIRLTLPNGSGRHEARLAKAAYMYKRLTIVYGTLCRENTPLTVNWAPENETMPTGEDIALIELFSRLQPAFEVFCNEKLTPDHDGILKGLIIEAPKIERRPSKKLKSSENGKIAVAKS